MTAVRMYVQTLYTFKAQRVKDAIALPQGMVEYSVKMLRAVSIGTDVRPVGCDIAAGQLVLQSRTVLGPSELGLLAAVGVKQTCVISQPVVAVLSTGNEVSNRLLQG